MPLCKADSPAEASLKAFIPEISGRPKKKKSATYVFSLILRKTNTIIGLN